MARKARLGFILISPGIKTVSCSRTISRSRRRHQAFADPRAVERDKADMLSDLA
ncbi:MAG: hypothetical protein J2P54_09290 [Bradyrhizobiaceae bacterium]|nr:hypothetical protein [Bradyrhizobiaceae bacterium]